MFCADCHADLTAPGAVELHNNPKDHGQLVPLHSNPDLYALHVPPPLPACTRCHRVLSRGTIARIEGLVPTHPLGVGRPTW